MPYAHYTIVHTAFTHVCFALLPWNAGTRVRTFAYIQSRAHVCENMCRHVQICLFFCLSIYIALFAVKAGHSSEKADKIASPGNLSFSTEFRIIINVFFFYHIISPWLPGWYSTKTCTSCFLRWHFPSQLWVTVLRQDFFYFFKIPLRFIAFIYLCFNLFIFLWNFSVNISHLV